MAQVGRFVHRVTQAAAAAAMQQQQQQASSPSAPVGVALDKLQRGQVTGVGTIVATSREVPGAAAAAAVGFIYQRSCRSCIGKMQ
jgi:hypothetical protein